MPEPKNLKELLSVKEINPGHYESIHPPFSRRAFQNDPSAFGGYSIGLGITAAYASLPSPKYHLYSALGNFLGPTFAHVPVVCAVRSVRDTTTFATRLVELKQQVRGAVRTVMTILCDFQTDEAPSADASLVYCAAPREKYASWQDTLPVDQLREKKLAAGEMTAQEAEFNKGAMKLIFGLLEQRPCTEGVFGQNMSGMARGAKTSQDGRKMTEKTTADWWRVKPGTNLKTGGESAAAMAYVMDSFMAFAALVFTQRSIEDGITASLDFSFRVFETGEDLDFNKWHLREVVTHQGGKGRTYSEARMWDEGGKMICCMTQQGIMRAPKKKEKL